MNRHRHADLTASAALAVVAGIAVLAGAPVAITAVLGIALFAAPGYLLSELLIDSHVAGLERMTVAAGLTLCVPILGGLVIYAAGLPLHRTAWLSLFAGVTLACDAALFFRRRAGQQAAESREREIWRMPPRRAVVFGAAVVIAIAAVGLARAGAALQRYPGYTQLWLVRPNHDEPRLDLGVGNHEGKVIQYRLVVRAHNGLPAAKWNITLHNGQAWHQSLRYPERDNISVNLFRLPNVSHPYRHVVLNINGLQSR